MEIKFNDWPFNNMAWVDAEHTRIRGHFNVGNPLKGDVILYNNGRFVITNVEWKNPIKYLTVRPFDDA